MEQAAFYAGATSISLLGLVAVWIFAWKPLAEAELNLELSDISSELKELENDPNSGLRTNVRIYKFFVYIVSSGQKITFGQILVFMALNRLSGVRSESRFPQEFGKYAKSLDNESTQNRLIDLENRHISAIFRFLVKTSPLLFSILIVQSSYWILKELTHELTISSDKIIVQAKENYKPVLEKISFPGNNKCLAA